MAIDRLFPDRLGRGTGEQPELDSYWKELTENFEADSAQVRTSGYGYIKAVDNEMLLETANKNQVVVRMLKRPGDFVGEGDAIALVWPGGSLSRDVERLINESLMLDAQRTATQDVEFVFNQIVEVAVRSLSPGINDPFTAIICIDHLGQGLRRMAERTIPAPCRYGEDGSLLVIVCPVTFPELADVAFDQIRHYGRSSAMVLSRLLETIGAIARHVNREEDRQALLRHILLIREAGTIGLEEKLARSEVEKQCLVALKALERPRN